MDTMNSAKDAPRRTESGPRRIDPLDGMEPSWDAYESLATLASLCRMTITVAGRPCVARTVQWLLPHVLLYRAAEQLERAAERMAEELRAHS